ncbi:hypothetical protein QDQ39_02310 [Providencia rettgeri]|uniref:hypothetical protein n=1 Tax=Providencia rettgeri TaxID=587 RepID=UPI002449D0C5|nr:hypothetical protein [Providencia rettgeri]MDH2394636.1 hypothetical protein [Providencia rettgeri]
MTIKDPITGESLVKSNHPILPDDGLDHSTATLNALILLQGQEPKHLINQSRNLKSRGNYVR